MKTKPAKQISAAQGRGVANIKRVTIVGNLVRLETDKRAFEVSVDDIVRDWTRELKWPAATRDAS